MAGAGWASAQRGEASWNRKAYGRESEAGIDSVGGERPQKTEVHAAPPVPTHATITLTGGERPQKTEVHVAPPDPDLETKTAVIYYIH